MNDVFLAIAILGLFIAQFGMWIEIRAMKRREQLRERGVL